MINTITIMMIGISIHNLLFSYNGLMVISTYDSTQRRARGRVKYAKPVR